MASIFDSTKTTTSELTPWSETIDPIKAALGLINNQPNWTSYQDDWVANMNQGQKNALDGSQGFGMGGMQTFGGNMMTMGQNMMSGYGQAQNFYNQALGWNPITNQGPDMQMVAMMADNPYMTGMIDAASRDITRNLYEDQMPGIAASSAGAGQTGSSRRGAAEAIAARGAADRIGDIAANMRGSAYEKALGIGADIASENAQLAFKNRTQGLDAADALRLIGGAGADLVTTGADMRRTGYQDALNAGDRYQQQEQAEIDALREQHMLDQQLPYDQATAALNVLMDPAIKFGKDEVKEVEDWDGELDVITALLTGGGGADITIQDLISGDITAEGGTGGQGGNVGDIDVDAQGGQGGNVGDVSAEAEARAEGGSSSSESSSTSGNNSGSITGNPDLDKTVTDAVVKAAKAAASGGDFEKILTGALGAGLAGVAIEWAKNQSWWPWGKENEGEEASEETEETEGAGDNDPDNRQPEGNNDPDVTDNAVFSEPQEGLSDWARQTNESPVIPGVGVVLDDNTMVQKGSIPQQIWDEIVKVADDGFSDNGQLPSRQQINDILGGTGQDQGDTTTDTNTDTNTDQPTGLSQTELQNLETAIFDAGGMAADVQAGVGAYNTAYQEAISNDASEEEAKALAEEAFDSWWRDRFGEPGVGQNDTTDQDATGILIGGVDGNENAGSSFANGFDGTAGMSSGISIGSGNQGGLGSEGGGLGGDMGVLGDQGGIFSGTARHSRMMANNAGYAAAYTAAINAGFSHEEAVSKAERASKKDD